MSRNSATPGRRLLLGAIAAAHLGFASEATPAALNLAQVPLAKASSTTVKPNVLFILDDSGSMAWDYLPDYVSYDSSDPSRPPMCLDSGDSDPKFSETADGSIAGPRNHCYVGDPPYMSPDFNRSYYSPEVVYQAGVNPDGSSKGNQDNLTSVRTDPYGTLPEDQLGNVATTVNLTTAYPERVYCDTPTASASDTVHCRSNANQYATAGTDYVFPSLPYVYGGPEFAHKIRFGAPYYYRIVPTRYCRKDGAGVGYLTDCIDATAASAPYTEPAPVRFCKTPASNPYSTALTDCQGKYDYEAGYRIPEYLGYVGGAAGSNATTTLRINSITNNRNWAVTSITFQASAACTPPTAANLLSATTNSSSSTTGLASNIAKRDNAGDADGIRITSSGDTVTIQGVGGWSGAALNGCRLTVVADRTSTGASTLTLNGSASTGDPHTFVAIATFAGGTSSSSARLGLGAFKRCDITPTADCAGLGAGRFPKSAARADCAAAGYCTYAEESRNFGNWYAYYRTRINAMKTASGLAFNGLETDGISNYRIGFMTIKAGNGSSNPVAGEYLRIRDFIGAQKTDWYDRLYGTEVNGGTPLRSALSKAGRIFAGKNPLALSATDDPMQYACQQNFAILTTDGYWNSDSSTDIKQVDGTTMGNADNAAPATSKFYDGAVASTACGSDSIFRSCGTLADVAYHYYNTDLRATGLSNCTSPLTGLDVCADVVPGSGDDKNERQHMTTYTLGLGVDGTLRYQEDYKSATSGDFHEINNPTRRWPAVRGTHPTGVDDLWHAAVNGHGQYFSAQSPAALTRNLTDALVGIKVQLGAGAAAATSNLEPVDGDNFSYVASYTTQYWYGNLEQRTISTSTGATSAQALWCVEDVAADSSKGTTACAGTLKAQVGADSDVRAIYLHDAAAPNKRRDFSWTSLTPAEKLLFNPADLSQYTTLSVDAKAQATGQTLLAYLRGRTQHEDRTGNTYRLYRSRVATLGDAVGSQPVFVKKPAFGYTDAGYVAFKTAQAARRGNVYLGTNEGMLHAFDADTGSERWAYVPRATLPKMPLVADFAYGNNHRFMVDGSPIAADICLADCAGDPAWATILVGGFGAGGRGYYALDITDPANPKGLWELGEADDGDFGYSFGPPIITKRDDGRWVVLVTSGYNNTGSGGSGEGTLFVIDAASGAILKKIRNGAGDTLNPSGLAKIEAFIERASQNNTTHHVYGGDLFGNVWRFTIDKDAETAVRIATVKDAAGFAQPITTRPVVSQLDTADRTRYIAVATGKLLEEADLEAASTQTQSVYAFTDVFDTNGNLAVGDCPGCTSGARNQLTQQHFIDEATVRPQRKTSDIPTPASPGPAVEGCFADLPIVGERVNVDMKLTLGNLAMISNVPKADACTAGGDSYISFFNYKTCKVAAGDSYLIGHAMAVGMVVLKLPSGYVITATLSNDPTPNLVGSVPPPPGAAGFFGRRVGWRLLYD